MGNRLEGESSPYLLQHAENPVEWYPWGPEALEKAREEDKPIFLSIGYAACHWCHVMAHESFEDPEVAAIMNEHFVNIKVDREERPDIDSLYMDAVVAMSGSGGWPMSVFLTPQGEPFFGGTYFPPERRHRLPAFRQVLLGVAQSWQQERDQLLSTGSRLAQHLKSGPRLPAGASELDESILQAATERLHESYDWTHGGWGRAPKFPQSSAIEFLLRRYHRDGDKHARDMALHALRAMARGGIYDQLGGGFARYSVDRRWLVPHFEKMLYDNALLLKAYLRGWQVSGDEAFRSVVEGCFAFLQREMRQADGGYSSSLDADSEGEEGKYYVWTVDSLRQMLTDDPSAELFMEAYGVAEGGNFEGKNVLHRAIELPALAERRGLSESEVEEALAEARQKLFKARQERTRPGLDDKVLTAWNGLLLQALAVGAQVLEDETWRTEAQSLATFLLESLIVDGRLQRSWRRGRARFNAYLEDHAALGLGLLALYATDFNGRWYRAAVERAEAILDRFQDPEGGFYDTPEDHEDLLARPKSVQDSPVPSGNTLAVALLQRLAALEGDERYWKAAEGAISRMTQPMREHPAAFAGWLSELDFNLGPVHQLALIGDPDEESFRSLAKLVHSQFRPNLVLAGAPADAEEGPTLLSGRERLEEGATAYLCQGFSCKLPTADAAVLSEQLAGIE